jgi:Putative transposase of IS4/5 family (DUF4096)
MIRGRMAMWTAKNRGRYDRRKLRYPSDLTNEEWALVEPMIPPAKDGGNKRRVNVREVVNGIMFILSTGLPMAGGSQGSSTSQHPFRLSGLMQSRRHVGSYASCALCCVPQTR